MTFETALNIAVDILKKESTRLYNECDKIIEQLSCDENSSAILKYKKEFYETQESYETLQSFLDMFC